MNLKSIFLLSDSQLLFWRDPLDGRPFVERLKDEVYKNAAEEPIRAAYLGAANEDDPEFFELFEAAMNAHDIINCMHIHTEPSEEEINFLKSAHLILLSGGDVDRAQNAFQKNDLIAIIRDKYSNGAVLVGVSAGAIQLARSTDEKQATLGIVPFVIDVHQEPKWEALENAVENAERPGTYVGIPRGAGLVYCDRGSLESIRFPAKEFFVTGDLMVKESFLLPRDESTQNEEIRYEPSETFTSAMNGNFAN